ncbi:MAG: hypothetical protein AVDCRST_MAG24-555 [uncultured Nocardioidaceae bacterium]|uniref:Uncharacterized protein n=1 Tax=uncultured Nocardioidaceae bacterium TaxID=253824 RepID=A0A6J4L946_9ACTN|nr:MAG: hypothetical protein AVDCRST_MAG24-555 [uncultured Nocardioidaceae bacterium]
MEDFLSLSKPLANLSLGSRLMPAYFFSASMGSFFRPEILSPMPTPQ